MSFPLLTVLCAFPLVGAAVVALLPAGRDHLAKVLALAVSAATLVIAAGVAIAFEPGGGDFQFVESYEWISAFGAHFALGVDGIGLVLVVLTAILVPVVVAASWHDADGGRWSVKSFFAWVLALEGLALGVFLAIDVFLFYVLFEATLIPIYFLIGGFGGAQRSYAAVKFLLFSLAGGLLMLASVVGLYVVSADAGSPTYLLTELRDIEISETTGRLLFLGFFIAFAVKAPMWPVHTWLPDAASQSTPGTSVLLVSILDKIGTFGMIRFCLQIFPEASQWATPVVVVLALVSIIYGALAAIGQTDVMRLIAYTSVSHFGLIVLGIFAFTSQGQVGATLYMFNHGLSTTALFLIAGFLVARHGSRQITDYHGVEKVAPVLAGTFLLAGLSSLSLPGLSPFVSEFLVLAGTFSRNPVAAAIATLAIVLAAIYILYLYQRAMTGPTKPTLEGMTDLGVRERTLLVPILGLIVVLGFFPQPLLDVITPAVDSTMTEVGVTDPEPPVPITGPVAEGGGD